MAIMNIKDSFKQGNPTEKEAVAEIFKKNDWYWGPSWGFPTLYNKNGGTPIGDGNYEILYKPVNDYILFTLLYKKSEEDYNEDYPYWYAYGGAYKDGEVRLYECDGNWEDVDSDKFLNYIKDITEDNGKKWIAYNENIKKQIINYLNNK